MVALKRSCASSSRPRLTHKDILDCLEGTCMKLEATLQSCCKTFFFVIYLSIFPGRLQKPGKKMVFGLWVRSDIAHISDPGR
ncbi:hypothetical protein SUGI_1008190 [Cryptomeria japonica]|nr:hypothetical protein SUGI_1008190 [Cryptomeria japonica]